MTPDFDNPDSQEQFKTLLFGVITVLVKNDVELRTVSDLDEGEFLMALKVLMEAIQIIIESNLHPHIQQEWMKGIANTMIENFQTQGD